MIVFISDCGFQRKKSTFSKALDWSLNIHANRCIEFEQSELRATVTEPLGCKGEINKQNLHYISRNSLVCRPLVDTLQPNTGSPHCCRHTWSRGWASTLHRLCNQSPARNKTLIYTHKHTHTQNESTVKKGVR